ncbi:Fc.00g035300.m01.CDS01 [Cosmosporella sp. VM-42]
MPLKRKLSSVPSDTEAPSKRSHPSPPVPANPPDRDIISTLSDELLIRIFSHLSETDLLSISPVSHHFRQITSDSQLWRTHYYTRFVLPRALRIPGFRVGGAAQSGSKLHYSARRAVWADGGWGRRGGLVDMRQAEGEVAAHGGRVDWKRQYKLRHNWARGKCAVEEVSVRDTMGDAPGQRTLVKVVEGFAVTADSAFGLRAWDLRTRRPIAQIDMTQASEEEKRPTCLAVDEQGLTDDFMDVILGFGDGGFGIWRLDLKKKELARRYRHEKSSNGELVSVAYSHPYGLTATTVGLISLYTFDRTTPEQEDNETDDANEEESGSIRSDSTSTLRAESPGAEKSSLPPPCLLTSLKSHTTQPPLALSIRKLATSVSASIAYTFNGRDGWSIGIQDINIKPSSTSGSEILSSRLAYTLPIKTGGLTPESSPSRSRQQDDSPTTGPTTLCYSHPYLLATLPDNTLILHLCTSTSTSLSLSPGIRLWGHTSGISDAEITPRGKAVSVSTRGDEIRVWELEGRVGGSSIEVRPRQQADDAEGGSGNDKVLGLGLERPEWEDRRNWVGFDDEMVIVLKEARDGRESLMVYDFT